MTPVIGEEEAFLRAYLSGPEPVESPIDYSKAKPVPRVRTGELETQLALDSLLDRDDAAEWTRKARHVIALHCSIGADFTAEHVRAVLGEFGDPPSDNLWGAVFKAAAREGWIKQVGYAKATRPDAHGRVLAVWRSAS